MTMESKIKKEEFSEETFAKKYNLQVIKPAQIFELPEGINFKALEGLGVDEEYATILIKKIVQFINAPIIIDQFNEDHKERRGWEGKMCSLYEDVSVFFDSNKLGINSSFNLIRVSSLVDKYIEKHESFKIPEILFKKARLIKNLKESYDEIMNDYNSKDLAEKIKAVNKLDDVFKEILELFKT